jgi:prepilin-type N-terminal cleavage/methylation domain-containing protein
MKSKKAFSLIEVIFVLVILGIVASISSQIIVQVYENYITQKAVYKVNTKTELAITQIVNRLNYQVENSALAKDLNDATNWIKLEDLNLVNDENLTVLEWIGYDNDSFSAGETPYWSGLANYTTATNTTIITPGSSLNNVDTIIKNLSNNEVGLIGTTVQHPALIFAHITGGVEAQDPSCMGLISNDTTCIFPVSENNSTSFTFEELNATVVTERYKLAWSAYALVPKKNNSTHLYDLYLHYNYQPWEGEKYDSSTTAKKLLIANVSTFKFTKNGGILQIKLCATENIGQDYNISTCKEKAIIR